MKTPGTFITESMSLLAEAGAHPRKGETRTLDMQDGKGPTRFKVLSVDNDDVELARLDAHGQPMPGPKNKVILQIKTFVKALAEAVDPIAQIAAALSNDEAASDREMVDFLTGELDEIPGGVISQIVKKERSKFLRGTVSDHEAHRILAPYLEAVNATDKKIISLKRELKELWKKIADISKAITSEYEKDDPDLHKTGNFDKEEEETMRRIKTLTRELESLL